MSKPVLSRILAVLPALVLFALGAQEGHAQEVTARVVDERSRQPVVAATALLLSPDSSQVAQVITGPDGFFQLSAPAPGPYLIQIHYPGYAVQTRAVTLDNGSSVIPAFVLEVTAIPLDTLQVEVTATRTPSQGIVGFSHPSHVLAGERLATLEQTGISFTTMVRELGPSIRTRGVMVGERNLTCIETTRRTPVMSRTPAQERNACDMVAIVIDGVNTGMDVADALRFVNYLQVSDWESIEYLSPVDAGTLYGTRAAANGALVLWTRGSGPHKSQARGGG